MTSQETEIELSLIKDLKMKSSYEYVSSYKEIDFKTKKQELQLLSA